MAPGDAADAEPLWRHPVFLGTLAAAFAAVAAAPLWWRPLSDALLDLELLAASWLPAEGFAGVHWLLLPLVGLGCGLLASFSPCVLPLVPLNVAAIGAAEASGARAAGLSARFVLGAGAALALFGLAGELTGFLFVEQRGPVLILAGAAMIAFGLVAVEVLPQPWAGRAPGAGRRLGPFATGAAFSLVTTPCASPFVGALLAAATAQAVPGLAVASMVAFALGYTALVFAAGVFGGSLVARLRRRSFAAPRAAAGALLLVLGAAFLSAGLVWF